MVSYLELIVAVIAAVGASSGFWAFIQKKTEHKDAKTKLLVGLAHDRIMQSGMYYIERGYITRDEYENLYDYLYVPYKELGGNGSAKRVMEEVKKLRVTSGIFKEGTINDDEK